MIRRGTPLALQPVVHERAKEIVEQLRRRNVIADRVFDETFFPLPAQRVSPSFWTPIEVAVRVAQLLVPRRATRVLDIGSGVGKFCIVGAAYTGALFVGVEHRSHFVRIATTAAARAGTDTARFFHGNFDIIDIRSFDSIYLFNPFEENCWPARDRLDLTVALSATKFYADVRRVETLLAGARGGTRVVTYHGFGGQMPDDYELVLRERRHSGYLDFWIKQQS